MCIYILYNQCMYIYILYYNIQVIYTDTTFEGSYGKFHHTRWCSLPFGASARTKRRSCPKPATEQ